MTIKRTTPDIDGIEAETLKKHNISAMVAVGNIYFMGGFVYYPGGDMAAQLAAIRQQISDILATEGMTLANVVATTTYTTDMDSLLANGHVLFDAFKDGPPTSAYIGVQKLAMPELLVEVVVTAAK